MTQRVAFLDPGRREDHEPYISQVEKPQRKEEGERGIVTMVSRSL